MEREVGGLTMWNPHPPNNGCDCKAGMWISGFLKTKHTHLPTSWCRVWAGCAESVSWWWLPNPIMDGFSVPSLPAAACPLCTLPLSPFLPWASFVAVPESFALVGSGRYSLVNPRRRKQAAKVYRWVLDFLARDHGPGLVHSSLFGLAPVWGQETSNRVRETWRYNMVSLAHLTET